MNIKALEIRLGNPDMHLKNVGLRYPEKPAATTLANCVTAAVAAWPQMIRQSLLSEGQKQKLLTYFEAHHSVAGVLRKKASA